MDPLFATTADYEEFISRHAKHQVPVKDLASYKGKAFLGIDAGSTTTKAALVGEDGTLLYSFYHNNDGDPLGTTITAIKDIYDQLPEGVEIVHSCSTEYSLHPAQRRMPHNNEKQSQLLLHQASEQL